MPRTKCCDELGWSHCFGGQENNRPWCNNPNPQGKKMVLLHGGHRATPEVNRCRAYNARNFYSIVSRSSFLVQSTHSKQRIGESAPLLSILLEPIPTVISIVLLGIALLAKPSGSLSEGINLINQNHRSLKSWISVA